MRVRWEPRSKVRIDLPPDFSKWQGSFLSFRPCHSEEGKLSIKEIPSERKFVVNDPGEIYDQWQEKQKAMGRKVPETTAPNIQRGPHTVEHVASKETAMCGGPGQCLICDHPDKYGA